MTKENPYPKGTIEHSVWERMPKKPSEDNSRAPVLIALGGIFMLGVIVLWAVLS